ncbi:MAG: hypothetical protein ACI9X4_002381 [Glaciecola sp.]|jgi:hypothetical protein
MTQSNNPSEGFEQHKPTGKQGKGPSMKERLIAQRNADAAAAAAGDSKAEAPAPKKAAPEKAPAQPSEKRVAAKPVKRATSKAAEAGDEAPAPAKRASSARRSGGAARTSSRRGGDEGEETGGRRGRNKPPEKNMTPIIGGGVAVVLIAAGAWFFMQDKAADDAANAQEQTAAQEAEVAKAEAAEAQAEAQRQSDADADADAAASTAAAEQKAAEAKKVADEAKANEVKEPQGPATEAPRKKGKQVIYKGEAGERYADGLYDPNDAAEPQIATFDLFDKATGCSDDDWAAIQKRAALLGDLESGAAGTRAALKLEKDDGQNAVPALVNVLLRLDYTTQEGQEAGDFVQRTLSRISNGRNADWRYGFASSPNKTIIQNRRTVNVWYGVWAKVVADPTYWDRFAGQTEAAKRAKKGPAAEPEPEDETDGLDDLLDDL